MASSPLPVSEGNGHRHFFNQGYQEMNNSYDTAMTTFRKVLKVDEALMQGLNKQIRITKEWL